MDKVDSKIRNLEGECEDCEFYNPRGCFNIKGKIICSTREKLIEYKIKSGETPYNWRT